MLDLVSVGEALIDFTPQGLSDQGLPLFAANPGGGPANLAVAAARLGGRVAFIGKVGADPFGRMLQKTLEQDHVDVSGLTVTEEAPTSLAFVNLDARGNRTFTFFRNPGADELLHIRDIRTDLIRQSRCLHFSSVTLTGQASRDATLFAARFAKSFGCLICYDPNWRPALWKSRKEGLEQLRRGALVADLIKATPEELRLLTGINREEDAVRRLFGQGVQTLILTRGGEGCTIFIPTGQVTVPAFPVEVRDTTGAGDAFLGALLQQLTQRTRPDPVSIMEWESMAIYANAAASVSVMNYGGIPSLPTRAELDQFLMDWVEV